MTKEGVGALNPSMLMALLEAAQRVGPVLCKQMRTVV